MMGGSKKWIVEVQHPKYFSKEKQWKNSVLVEKDEYDASIDALVVCFRHKIIISYQERRLRGMKIIIFTYISDPILIIIMKV